MFVDFLAAVVGIDFSWFAELFSNNILVSVMVFITMAIFFKFQILKAVFATALIFVQIWVIDDAVGLLGGFFISGAFMLIYYVSKLAVLTAAEEDPKLQPHLIAINEAAWMVPLLLFNLWKLGFI